MVLCIQSGFPAAALQHAFLGSLPCVLGNLRVWGVLSGELSGSRHWAKTPAAFSALKRPGPQDRVLPGTMLLNLLNKPWQTQILKLRNVQSIAQGQTTLNSNTRL